jgi:hypothetical protein
MALTIKDNPKEILDNIVEAHGIDFIREYIKAINKGNRKQSIRVNSFWDVYNDVKEYMDGYSNGYDFEKYSYTRAITKVAENRNISESAVKTHYTKGKKEAVKREQEKSFKRMGIPIIDIDDNNIPF